MLVLCFAHRATSVRFIVFTLRTKSPDHHVEVNPSKFARYSYVYFPMLKVILFQTTHYPFQEVFCKKLRGGDIKLWLDPKKDKALLLLNIAKATKDTNGKFDPQADVLHVDYFIR